MRKVLALSQREEAMVPQAADIEALRREVAKLRDEAASHAEAMASMSKLREDLVGEKAALSECLTFRILVSTEI